jgi:phage-related minor tail protein
MGGHVDAKAMLSGIAQRAGGRALDSIFDTIIGAILPWANGGIVTGGFRAFANGGTVTKPTLGLVGEGKYNEAVVPLPDGKSIPVIGATGSTENNITVNVTVDSNGKASTDTSGGSSKDNAKQLGYMVSQAVQSEIVSQQRPGGLLSQY